MLSDRTYAYPQEINAKQVLRAGFHKHLAKPVEPSELIEAIVPVLVKTSK